MSSQAAARTIWEAGVNSVRAEHLVSQQISLDLKRNALRIGLSHYSLEGVQRLCVVGGGKAAGYLALALESILEPIAEELEIHGWVNVPSNCVEPTRYIQLHAGRPAGVNEPRQEGVEGTREILRIVGSLQPDDLCLCLLTGGGSALLPAPAQGVSLEDKIHVTRLLSAAGASIQELNRVRIAMSSVKGGGLVRACQAERMVTVIVSDIIGDPIELIASGPTVPSTRLADAKDTAMDILRRYASNDALPDRLWKHLEELAKQAETAIPSPPKCHVDNVLLANNASAIDAAAKKACQLGYEVRIVPPESSDASVEDVAEQLVRCIAEIPQGRQSCILWGGEPTVRLVPNERRGRGGRNQQLVVETLLRWERFDETIQQRLCILSGGTDGEDGPTDAAGAFVDHSIVDLVRQLELDPEDYLVRNDSYTLLDSVHALLKTGPTHTNVCDIRVAVIH